MFAAILIFAGIAVFLASRGQKVQYIHVITPNNSCDGIQAMTSGQQGTSTSTSSNSSSGRSAPGNSAGAIAGADLLRYLLPLTNLSALQSSQVLDAAKAANVSVQQLQPLMQLHQQLWCRCDVLCAVGCVRCAMSYVRYGLCDVQCVRYCHKQPNTGSSSCTVLINTVTTQVETSLRHTQQFCHSRPAAAPQIHTQK